jgi:hypothetical protein
MQTPPFTRKVLTEICQTLYEEDESEELSTPYAIMLLSLAVLKVAEELARLRQIPARGVPPQYCEPPDPPEAREFLPRRRPR